MNKKIFKYENKNSKLLRLKDLLMLFSIFALCIISIIYAGTKANENSENISVVSEHTTSDGVESKTEQAESEVQSDISAEMTDALLVPELEFKVPVDGAVIKPFSQKELIYSETMDDWRIHNGIDLACPYGTEVISAERGIVRSVSHDINLGNVVIVETDEYELVYASLSSDIAVSPEQKLQKGDVIGKTSDSCMLELCDEPHLHFEMKKNGVYIDPLSYIKFE